MFDIVVCSSNLDLIKRSVKVVNKALVGYDFNYHIDKCMSKNIEINNNKRKIYIIDNNMIDLAYRIRKNDFISIIIIINSCNLSDIELLHKKLLILDYIYLNNDYDDNLLKDINMGLKILLSDNVFSFKYNYIIYRIPYTDINYIEKEPNVKRCIIHTIDSKYYIVNSIENIYNSLDAMFIKSSQSCIINVMNIKYLDCTNNVICFNNGDMTNLITDKVKKLLIDNMY